MEKKQGFLQATGVAAYCFFIGLIFGNLNKFFPQKDPFLAPVLMLILFSASVLICALIVFYKPYNLFFKGKKKEAIDIVLFNAIGLVFYVVLAFILLLILK